MENIKYTKDGVEVTVINKINEGYLAKPCYSYYNEDQDEDIIEELSDNIMFYDKLFDSPPTEKYADEIVKLKEQAEDIKSEIAALRIIRDNDKSLISKVSKYPIVQQLVDYITGDFNFVLYIKDFEVSTKNQIYHSPYIAMAYTKSDGYFLYRLRNENYFSSSDDIALVVFKTMEDLTIYAKNLLLVRIKEYSSNYNAVSNFQDFFKKVHYSSKLKEDADIISAYNNKLLELTEIENKQKKERLQKEIDEFEKKRKELESLN